MPRQDHLTLGVAISDAEIRVVLADPTDQVPTVRAAAMALLPSGAVVGGVVHDRVAVTYAIRELLKPLRAGFKVRTVVGISSSLVETRHLSIPPCDDREIPTLVEGELEHQGTLVEDCLLETVVHPQKTTGPSAGMRSVTAMMVDQDVVRRAKDAVEAAGLRVDAVETSQTGKLRAATLALPSSAATLFLVMGPNLTGLSYFSGSDPVASRRVEVGSTSLVRRQSTETSPSPIESALTTLRVDHAAVDRLAIESLQLMEFVQRDYTEEIESVRIYAVESELEALAPMLERRFGIPTSFSPPPPGLEDIRYSVAYGLAIRDHEGPYRVPKLDLSSKLRIQSGVRETKQNLVGSMLASGFALAAGLSAFLLYGRLIGSVGTQVQKTSASLAEVQARVAADKDRRANHDTLYGLLQKDGAPLTAVMDDVVGGLDAGIRLKTVDIRERKVQIQGEAQDEGALGRATQRLQTSSVLKDVSLAQLDRSTVPGSTRITFEIDATTVAADQVAEEKRS